MAAFKAAQAFTLPISGYVPKYFTNETGAYGISAHFRPFLKETSTTDSAERTKLNIRNADGILTLLQAESGRSEVSKGTQLGIDHARELEKKEDQLCFVDIFEANTEDSIGRVFQWIEENRVEKCLIGGPRESEAPGIEEKAFTFLCSLFEKLSVTTVRREIGVADTR